MARLGKWGRMHREQLRRNDPEAFRALEQAGELSAYLADVDRGARRSLDRLLRELLERDPPPEWSLAKAGHVEGLRRAAEEIVMHDMILAPDAETRAARRDGYTGTGPDFIPLTK